MDRVSTSNEEYKPHNLTVETFAKHEDVPQIIFLNRFPTYSQRSYFQNYVNRIQIEQIRNHMHVYANASKYSFELDLCVRTNF